MSSRARAGTLRFPVASAVAMAASVTGALIIWLALETHQTYPTVSLLMPATFTGMGSLIVWRQPRNTVGWIVLLSGPLPPSGSRLTAGRFRSFAPGCRAAAARDLRGVGGQPDPGARI